MVHPRLRPFAPVALAAGLALLAGGCSQSFAGDDYTDELPPTPEGPGQQEWSDEDVSCAAISDCGVAEACIQGVCQMARCQDGPYDSTAPIGGEHTFFSDREILSLDGNMYEGQYWVDGYAPSDSAVTYIDGSWAFGQEKPVDVAGGNVFGQNIESLVVASEGKNTLRAVKGLEVENVDVGFVPVAIAAADFDHDSVDEVVALSAAGKFAMCEIADAHCDAWQFQGDVQGQNVAAGDIDADGYDEAVFQIKNGDQLQLVTWNPHFELTGESELSAVAPDVDGYTALSVGDINNDGRAEIFALDDGGFAGFNYDNLHVYEAIDGSVTRILDMNVDADSKDIAVADTNMDGAAEVVLLFDDKSVRVYQSPGDPATLNEKYTSELTVSGNPQRIALADVDGDSPRAALVEGPELLTGDVVPTSTMMFPPYSRSHSGGVSTLLVGDGTTSSEAFTDSVALRVGIEVGVEAGISGLFAASVAAKLSRELTTSRTLTKQVMVGTRFFIRADPELHGTNYGVVVLASGCFHQYTYQLSDPTARLGEGADGGRFVVVVPVGGQTTVWSTRRYNAMADAVGGLPHIEVAGSIGDPSSYPTSPTRVDGTPIAPEDMLFPDPPQYLTSDVGEVGWWLEAGESETNQTNLTTSLGVSSSINAGGFKFGADVGVGLGSGYSITVGSSAFFSGSVPPIPDDPETPEDEYQTYAFSFSPVVYSEPYTAADGQPASYYVLNYIVGE